MLESSIMGRLCSIYNRITSYNVCYTKLLRTYILSAKGRATIDTRMTMTIAGISTEFPSIGVEGGEIWEEAISYNFV